MEQQTTFSILFWLKKSKAKNGKAPISVRITVNGERAELSAQREASILEWDPKAQMVIGRGQEAKDINNHLAVIKSKLLACQTKIENRNEEATAEAIKAEYLGKKKTERKKITEAFLFKLTQLKGEISKDKKAQATYDKYEDTMNHVKAFIIHQYKKTDKYFDEVTYPFISDFEYYLSVIKNLSQNTYMKYISLTKSIFRLAKKRGWLAINPIEDFSCSFDWKDPIRLEMHELIDMYQKEFQSTKLEEAKDVFVFMCYTGFAYNETASLGDENVFWGIDKQQWITKDRRKTDGTECVPLLDIPREIIEKYKNHPYCKSKGILLPVYSNVRFNAYLKEVAAICDINKNLTTHSGRHTFATTVTLENDVPLETVGKMLGHKSIKSTQRYARVTRNKINNNMNELKTKLIPIMQQAKTGS
jgi:site-specific recombinase XerD